MCDLNGPFRLCSCSDKIDYTKPHWILHQKVTNKGEESTVIIGMMFPISLLDKIERKKILRRLNTTNVFDFNYSPTENDQLELNYEEEDGLKFNFINGRWKFEEWYGEHPIFEFKHYKEGTIDSKTSKLKRVYEKYLKCLEEGEMDITQYPEFNHKISEKKLIMMMERRIKGEKTELK